jgi:hypothetical protein
VVLVTRTQDKLETKYPWLKSVLKAHRATPLVVVNTTTHLTSFQKSLPTEEESGGHPRVVFLQRAREAGEGDAGKVTFQARAMRDFEFGEAALGEAIVSAQNGALDLRPLSKKPTIKSLK